MRRFHSLALALALACGMTVPAHARAAATGDVVPSLVVAEADAKARPRVAAAWITLARARIEAGRTGPAVDAAQRAVQLAPDDAEAHYWLGNAYGNRMGDVGMLGKLGLAPKLRDAFERTIELDPAHVKARNSLVEFYLMAPSMLGGGVDKARAQALEIGKRDKARGLLAQARIAGHEEQAARVLQLHQAALAAAPDDVEIQFTVAMAHVEAEQWSVAVPLLRKVVAREPENAAAWYQIGRSAAVSGEFLDEGAAALQRYMAMPHRRGQPEIKHALYRLGQVQARAGHPDQARATWQRALELDPKFAEVKAELAKSPGG